MWLQRGLSLIGRILVINTLAISQLIYKFLMITSMDNVYLLQIQDVIREYLWSGKKPKIAYAKLVQDFPSGGLKIIDIFCKSRAMKASWVWRLYNNEDGYLAQEFYSRVKPVGKEIRKCNLHKRDVSHFTLLDRFWREVLFCWCDINFIQPKCKDEVLC